MESLVVSDTFVDLLHSGASIRSLWQKYSKSTEQEHLFVNQIFYNFETEEYHDLGFTPVQDYFYTVTLYKHDKIYYKLRPQNCSNDIEIVHVRFSTVSKEATIYTKIEIDEQDGIRICTCETAYIHLKNQFSSIVFSENTQKIMFIGEKIDNKADPFLYIESFGNALEKVRNPTIFSLSLRDLQVSEFLHDKPENIYPSKILVFENMIYFLASVLEGFKEGLVYCNGHKMCLFVLDDDNIKLFTEFEDTIIDAEFYKVKDLRIALFLTREIGGPHEMPTDVVIINLPNMTRRTAYKELFCDSLPKSIVYNEKTMLKTIYLTETLQSYMNTKLISLSWIESEEMSYKVHDIGNGFSIDILTSFKLVDSEKHLLMLSCSSILTPPFLACYDTLSCKIVYNRERQNSKYQTIKSVYLTEDYHETLAKDSVMSYFLIMDDSEKPLILLPHGGPHSVYVNTFFRLFHELAKLYTLLFVNYQGSLGLSAEVTRKLTGKIGFMDVEDVVNCYKNALKSFKFQPRKTIIMGGSHGGFIAAHICGIYPNMFDGCILLNPVIDLAANIVSSDIPEWVHVETGVPYVKGQHPKDLNIFGSMSPSLNAHKVITPTVLFLGRKDKRVDYSQGHYYAKILRANGCYVRVNVYENCTHSLKGPKEEIHKFQKIMEFINEL